MDYGWDLRGAAFIRLQHLDLAPSFFRGLLLFGSRL